ncbi:beta-lactamase/transpeptidase-like protein [Pleomassaria siparia CBS 279.74]|uniref:Beta-lactamase/transpeptidase-like protein n=1 Tax=Pleomassaria siparia CBS 279.74 TaxID=1314801 RepID=A0A6G1KJS7_9PLEO|nr:beta-lactamase/transpeptidase-like protein [Pleomassaria siparia CBS 279.74]
MNETVSNSTNQVTSNSVFRVASVSKSFAMFSALTVETESKAQSTLPELTLDTPVRLLLPNFRLPEKDWNSGGRDITLSMLASHTSGLPREGYLTPFNMVTGMGKANSSTIGALWAGATPAEVLEKVANTNLMFAPGQRAAYSNSGLSVLASAVVSYYNSLHNTSLTWSELAMHNVLAPLNMTSSFFGAIPKELISDIGVPGSANWVDIVVGLGYDPAAGMWSSANDLSKYLYNIWLRPDPSLITLDQRRRTLRPTITLPDGKQQAGPALEIDLITVPVSSNTSKTYSAYGKSGDGGGFHAWIDTIPNLGYGIVIMSQESGLANYSSIVPTRVRDAVHGILMPAFATALTDRTTARFAGWYANGVDGGAIADETAESATNHTTYARLEVADQILYLREMLVNGTNAMEGLDRLSWVGNDGTRSWSTPAGVALTASDGAGENAEFGTGAQVWRIMLPNLDVCDWFDFDGYTDENGWPLSKLVLVERDDTVELHYPPYDIILSRNKQ